MPFRFSTALFKKGGHHANTTRDNTFTI